MRRKTSLAGALAAIGLAAGLTLAGTGTARADVTPSPDNWAEIFNPYLHAQGITLCADDPSGSTRSGVPLQLFRCHGYASNGAPQRWVFVQVEDANGNPVYHGGSAVYEVYNLAGGMCLTALDGNPGGPVTLGTCQGNITVWWELHSAGGASPDFQLTEFPNDTTCVSASNFSDSNGTRLVMENCNRLDASQVWNLG